MVPGPSRNEAVRVEEVHVEQKEGLPAFPGHHVRPGVEGAVPGAAAVGHGQQGHLHHAEVRVPRNRADQGLGIGHPGPVPSRGMEQPPDLVPGGSMEVGHQQQHSGHGGHHRPEAPRGGEPPAPGMRPGPFHPFPKSPHPLHRGKGQDPRRPGEAAMVRSQDDVVQHVGDRRQQPYGSGKWQEPEGCQDSQEGEQVIREGLEEAGAADLEGEGQGESGVAIQQGRQEQVQEEEEGQQRQDSRADEDRTDARPGTFPQPGPRFPEDPDHGPEGRDRVAPGGQDPGRDRPPGARGGQGQSRGDQQGPLASHDVPGDLVQQEGVAQVQDRQEQSGSRSQAPAPGQQVEDRAAGQVHRRHERPGQGDSQGREDRPEDQFRRGHHQDHQIAHQAEFQGRVHQQGSWKGLQAIGGHRQGSPLGQQGMEQGRIQDAGLLQVAQQEDQGHSQSGGQHDPEMALPDR